MAHNRDDATPGAEDELQTTRLPTARLNCPWKAARIADYVQDVHGVVEASIKPRADTVVVRYDPSRTSETAITAAIEKAPSGSVRNSAGSSTRGRSGGCRCRCCGGSN